MFRNIKLNYCFKIGHKKESSYLWLLDADKQLPCFLHPIGNKLLKPKIKQKSLSSPFWGQLSFSYPNDIIQAPILKVHWKAC